LISFAGIQDATNLLDLNLSWSKVANTPIDLSLFATNVTNKKYYVFSGGDGTTGAEFENAGPPRTYGVRLKVAFGGR
jgi:iron complex outermembrane receptor protein